MRCLVCLVLMLVSGEREKQLLGRKGRRIIYQTHVRLDSLFLLISDHVTPLRKQQYIAILEDTTRKQATNQKIRMHFTVDVYAIIVAGRVCAYL